MSKNHTFYMFDLENPTNDVCMQSNKRIDESKIISELSTVLSTVNENDTFSAAVRFYLKSKHLTTKDLYDRAYIDRRLIHKILKSNRYHPAKKTVLALCIAFELSYGESLDLLGLASYSFAPNSKSDVIFQYFITKGIYDIDLINDALYRFRCPCIGD